MTIFGRSVESAGSVVRRDGTLGDIVFLVAVILMVCLALYDVVAVRSTFTYLFSDGWEHSAALRMLIERPFAPLMPHLGVEGDSARFIPQYVLAALIAGGLGGDGADALLWLGVVNVFLIALGVYLFSRSYFRSRIAPAIVLVVLYGAWGSGMVWSNSTALVALPYVAGFPSNLAFALTWFLWLAVLMCGRADGRPRSLLGYSLFVGLGSLLLVTHLPTALFAFVGALLIGVFQFGLRLRTALLGLAVLASVAIAEFWPYYSVVSLVLADDPLRAEQLQALLQSGAPTRSDGGLSTTVISGAGSSESALERFSGGAPRLDTHPFYQFTDVAVSYGIGLIGFALIPFALVKQGYAPFAIGSLLFLGIYFFHTVYALPMGHRALLFAGTFAHLILAAALIEIWTVIRNGELSVGGWQRKAASGLLLGLVLSIVASIGLVFYKLRPVEAVTTDTSFSDRADWLGLVRDLGGRLEPNSVLLAPAPLSWALPTVSGRVIVLQHPSPFFAGDRATKSAVRRFFAADTPTQERSSIAESWAADYAMHQEKNLVPLFEEGILETPIVVHGIALSRLAPTVAPEIEANSVGD